MAYSQSAYAAGFTSAMIVAWGGVGGILASTLFMDSEAKIGYPTGEFNSTGALSFSLLYLFCIWVRRAH